MSPLELVVTCREERAKGLSRNGVPQAKSKAATAREAALQHELDAVTAAHQELTTKLQETQLELHRHQVTRLGMGTNVQ